MRVAAREDTDDVAVDAVLPVDVGLHGGLSAAGHALEGLAVGLAHPEAWHIHRHAQPLDLSLAARGVIGLDEDHRGGIQQRDVEPALAAVEVHQDDGVLDVLAVEIREPALADVDDRAGEPLGGDGAGAGVVGPEAVDLVALPAHLQRRALLKRGRQVELLHVGLHTKLFKGIEDHIGCLLVARVAGHTGAESGHLLDARLQALGGDLACEIAHLNRGRRDCDHAGQDGCSDRREQPAV